MNQYKNDIYLKHLAIVFLLGFYLYPLIEILWRGRTHISMAFCGGICFAVVYLFFNLTENATLAEKCMIGALLVTGIELITGVFVNGVMGLNVWDYSDMPFNLFGQICPTYYVLWALLMLPANFLSRFISRALQTGARINKDIIYKKE